MTPQQGTLTKLAKVQDLVASHPEKTLDECCKFAGISMRTAYRHGITSNCNMQRRYPNGHPNKIPRAHLLEILRIAAAELGHSPTTLDFETGRFGVYPMTYYRNFDSWDAALEEAGLEKIEWQARGLPAKMRLRNYELAALGILS